MITVWTTHSYDKLRLEMTKPENASTEYKVYAAKRETEGFHIALRADSDVKDLCINVSGRHNGVKVDLFHVRGGILELDGKKYTDPAVPLKSGERFDLKADATMPVLVEFTTYPETAAGEYEYVFYIADKEGNPVASATATLRVWNFEMPLERKFRTSCGNLMAGYYLGEPYYDYDRMHYEMLLDHNLSGYVLPKHYLSDESYEWMSDPRVTSFMLYYRARPFDWKFTEEEHQAVYDRIMSNPEWAKKAYYYSVDEPSTPEHVQALEETYGHIRKNFPGIKTCSPFYLNVQLTEETDQIDLMSQYIDLHCPKLSCWDDDQIYSEEQKKKYPPFAERMKALQDRGDTVWAYVCNIPKEPYLNVLIDSDGLGSRVLFWQMYQRNIEGFLYWHSVYWSADPWRDTNTFGGGWYGDGALIYTGDEVGYHKYYPIPSIRLKIIRDGIDDIELMYMAEELLGREWVDGVVNKVSSKLTSVDVSYDEFAVLRIELGNAVEAELAKQSKGR